MTDFSALISNPKHILVGAAAQFGIFGAYMVALLLGFEPNQAAGIAIIVEQTAQQLSSFHQNCHQTCWVLSLFARILIWQWFL